MVFPQLARCPLLHLHSPGTYRTCLGRVFWSNIQYQECKVQHKRPEGLARKVRQASSQIMVWKEYFSNVYCILDLKVKQSSSVVLYFRNDKKIIQDPENLEYSHERTFFLSSNTKVKKSLFDFLPITEKIL